jgi:hypothetical protein
MLRASKMPMATKKTAGRAKVGKVMHEFKHGQLKSGGKRKVKNPKQAIAIALSEARHAGADVPPKKKAAAKKKGAAKKKSAPAKKSAAKKKSTAKKTTKTSRKRS